MPDLTDEALERAVGRLYLRYATLEEQHEELRREHRQTLDALLARIAREGHEQGTPKGDSGLGEGEGHAARMGAQTA